MTSQSFASRVAELDAVVERCMGQGPFKVGEVRDASNRSNRDWPSWGVQIEQTHIDGSETVRVIAKLALNATPDGAPGSLEASWRAQVWQGVGPDTFRQDGTEPFESQHPTPKLLQETMAALLRSARAAIATTRP